MTTARENARVAVEHDPLVRALTSTEARYLRRVWIALVVSPRIEVPD